MPRQARLVFADVALHVVQRGHNRQDCFRHETDRLVYLANLRDLTSHTGCALHAYCLMTNHIHLLLTPASSESCGVLMRNLGQRYAQYFNRRYDRRGSLWEGRYKSCLVQSASYLLACHRYIERNPVRAGMVSGTVDYPWSSYAGNAGYADNKLLKPHDEYVALAAECGRRHLLYREFVELPDEPSFLTAIRDATNGGFAVVDPSFASRLPAHLQPRLARRTPGPRPASSPARDQIMLDLGLRPAVN